MIKYTQVSESSSEISGPTEQDIVEVNSREKTPSLFKRVGARLIATGQIATLAIVLTTACSKGEKEIQRSPTAEYFPPGVRVETNRPMPSETALKSATATQTPEKTAVSTTTPEGHQEYNLEVVLAESLIGTESETLASGITVGEFEAKVEQIAGTLLPANRDRKIVINKSEDSPGHNYYDNTSGENILNIDLATSPESLAYVLAHEDGHAATNVNYWLHERRITPKDYNNLVDTIREAKADTRFGLPDNFDVISDYFASDNFIKARNTPKGQAEGAIFAAKIRDLGENIMLWGRENPNQNNDVEKLINTSVNSLIDQMNTSPELAQLETSKNLTEILEDPTTSAILENEAKNNPFFAIALEKMKEHAPLFDDTKIHTESSPVHIRLLGSTKGQTIVNIAKYLATAELQNEIRIKNQRVMDMLHDQNQSVLINYVASIDEKARAEIAADQYAYSLLFPEKTDNPGTEIVNLVKSY